MRTSELSELTGLDRKTIARWANVLPTEAIPVRRVPTNWTLSDTITIIVADRLCRRGFSEAVAMAFTAMMAADFVDLVADEEAALWLLGWPDGATELGWTFKTFSDKSAGLDLIIEHSNSTILAVHDLVRDALAVYAASSLGSPNRG